MRYTLTAVCVVEVKSLRELEELLEALRYEAKAAVRGRGIVTAVTSFPDNSGSASLIGGGGRTSDLPLETPEEESGS